MTYQDPRYRDPEYAAKWRAANPEKVKAQRARTLERHREENRERASRHYYANRESRLAKQKAYYAANHQLVLDRMAARKYGLDLDAYRALIRGAVCAICGADGVLGVDHDHDSGVVRGVLCVNCNFLIGHGKDDPALLRAAADYLEATQ